MLGFDPLETPMSWERFGLLVRGRKAKLKTLLADQAFYTKDLEQLEGEWLGLQEQLEALAV